MELKQNAQVFHGGLYPVIPFYPTFKPGNLFQLFLCRFGIVPEIRIVGLLFFFFNADGKAIYVKDASLTHPGAC
jgi:hypothetical protein